MGSYLGFNYYVISNGRHSPWRVVYRHCIHAHFVYDVMYLVSEFYGPFQSRADAEIVARKKNADTELFKELGV